MRFARIIEFKAGQLIISITTDSDVDGFVLIMETYCQGTFIKTNLPFPSFDEASQAMNELSQDKVEQIYPAFTALVSDPSAKTLKRGVSEAVEGFDQWLTNETSKQIDNGKN